MSELKKCPECNKPFNWDDQIIYVETLDDHYHEKCVELYPIKYFAVAHSEPLGEVDKDVDFAYEYLLDGEYIDVEESEIEMRYEMKDEIKELVYNNLDKNLDKAFNMRDEINRVYSQAAKSDEYEAKAKAFDAVLKSYEESLSEGHMADDVCNIVEKYIKQEESK